MESCGTPCMTLAQLLVTVLHMKPILYSSSHVPYRLWCFIDCSIDVFCILYLTVLLLYFVSHVCTHHRERLPVPRPMPVFKSTL